MICPFVRYDVKLRVCLARCSAGAPAVIRPGECCGPAYESCRDYRMAVWEGIVPLPRATSACRADGPEGTRNEPAVPPAKSVLNGS